MQEPILKWRDMEENRMNPNDALNLIRSNPKEAFKTCAFAIDHPMVTIILEECVVLLLVK